MKKCVQEEENHNEYSFADHHSCYYFSGVRFYYQYDKKESSGASLCACVAYRGGWRPDTGHLPGAYDKAGGNAGDLFTGEYVVFPGVLFFTCYHIYPDRCGIKDVHSDKEFDPGTGVA